MEKAGCWRSYYPDVDANRLKRPKVGDTDKAGVKKSFPSPEGNPLDECRMLIAYYKRCCDRELQKKKNWMLTEPYRVQEEYRYDKSVPK